MSYKVIDQIGQGGFGIVEKVKDNKGKIFARKTFHISEPNQFDAAARESVKKRFIREINVQKNLSHKNIVPIVDADLTANPPNYIMPLAICSLADDIREEKTLNGNFMEALMDILAGLEALHKLGFRHRDLKPANVLRYEDGKGKMFYAIGDFGLVSVNQMTSLTSITSITQTGTMMRSDMYTAPEITANLKHASPMSDIYSVGCILHDFVGIVPQRIPCAEINERNNPFQQIMLICTRKEVDRRFKTVGALRDALLTMKKRKLPAETEKGKEIFSLLNEDSDEELKLKEWEIIVEYVEDQFPSEDSVSVLEKLDMKRITSLILLNEALATRLGLAYAKWIRGGSFQFEDCDGLATRLEKFLIKGGIEVQAECLMAMLYMGTDHNRWYVEKKFVNHVNKEMDGDLADRLAIEIRADETDACSAFQHLTRSIGFELKSLHSTIYKTLSEICDGV